MKAIKYKNGDRVKLSSGLSGCIEGEFGSCYVVNLDEGFYNPLRTTFVSLLICHPSKLNKAAKS